MYSATQIMDWSNGFCIGLPEIDDQHKTLIDLMNDLWRAIAVNAPQQECKKVLDHLEHYTITHFTAEETMMRAMDYPNFDAHCSAHRHFVKRLQEEKRQFEQTGKLGLDILHFLRDWLVNHILANDKAYAAYYAAREQPVGFLGRFFSRFKMA